MTRISVVAISWLALVSVALVARPILPVDETRYLAVAWEMWLGGDYLVPHLNGAPYSHKPPLLFWLINGGWAVLGVNETWPRLVAPLFGLASLFLTASLARRLWPALPQAATAAPLVLMGFGLWTLFMTLTMFDLLMACFTLVGLHGVARAARGGRRGWVILGLAMALGILAKGPAIFLHLLPAPFLAPLWLQSPAGGWRRWYGGIALALLLGAGVALAWAVPAAIHGGEVYRDAILWGQTAGRMVGSFAHGRAWWWYLVALPAALLPLIAWPTLWKGPWKGTGILADGGARFCLAWFLPALVLSSLVSGKQLHYLLPDLPALALLAAFLICRRQAAPRRDLLAPALLMVAVGIAVLALPFVPLAGQWGDLLAAPWGLAILAAAAAAALMPAAVPLGRLAALSGLCVVTAMAIHLAVRPALADRFNVSPLAVRLGEWEREGRPLANYGAYHGQYHFAGRLRDPMAIIGDGEVVAWVAANPRGVIVTYQDRLPSGAEPLFAQPYRNRLASAWDAARVAADPRLVRRPD